MKRKTSKKQFHRADSRYDKNNVLNLNIHDRLNGDNIVKGDSGYIFKVCTVSHQVRITCSAIDLHKYQLPINADSSFVKSHFLCYILEKNNYFYVFILCIYFPFNMMCDWPIEAKAAALQAVHTGLKWNAVYLMSLMFRSDISV